MNKFLKKRSGKSNDELKEKVAANFNTAKADAILEKLVLNEPVQKQYHKRSKRLGSLCGWRNKVVFLPML